MTRRINGRDKENQLYKALSKYNLTYRFNENRWTATPADLIVFTKKYNILIEVKAGSKQIAKSNIRPSQLQTLIQFEQVKASNRSILVFYFRYPRPTWAWLPVSKLHTVPSYIKPQHVQHITLERLSVLLSR